MTSELGLSPCTELPLVAKPTELRGLGLSSSHHPPGLDSRCMSGCRIMRRRAQASVVEVVTIPAENRSATTRRRFSSLKLLSGFPLAWVTPGR